MQMPCCASAKFVLHARAFPSRPSLSQAIVRVPSLLVSSINSPCPPCPPFFPTPVLQQPYYSPAPPQPQFYYHAPPQPQPVQVILCCGRLPGSAFIHAIPDNAFMLAAAMTGPPPGMAWPFLSTGTRQNARSPACKQHLRLPGGAAGAMDAHFLSLRWQTVRTYTAPNATSMSYSAPAPALSAAPRKTQYNPEFQVSQFFTIMHARTHACIHTQIHTHEHTHTHKHTHTHTHTHAHTHTHTQPSRHLEYAKENLAANYTTGIKLRDFPGQVNLFVFPVSMFIS